MANATIPPTYVQELAEFLAAGPSRKQLITYRPPKTVQHRACNLLEKQNAGDATYAEQKELEEYTYADRLMRLIKAQLRVQKKKP